MNIRRVLKPVVVYGLIGLIVNVLVAWGFAAWATVVVEPISSIFEFNDPAVRYDPNLAFSVRHPALDGPPIFRLVGRTAGVDVLLESADGLYDLRNGPMHDENLIVARFGWPWRALRWWEITRRGIAEPVAVDPVAAVSIAAWPGVSRSPLVSWTPNWGRRLPMGPLWRGLICNTAIYGAAVGAGVWTTGRVRRAIRRRRGLCPSCAYDLRGDRAGGCPECGWGRAAAKP